MKHFISYQDKTPSEVLTLFERADQIKTLLQEGKPLSSLSRRIIATVFLEPSTRTRFSFESAVYRLGGQVITSENGKVTGSTSKGESIEDTIRMLNCYADAIVMRHSDIDAPSRAITVSDIPVINAGNGAGEHPTQALLDAYTVREKFGSFKGLTIGVVGDLKHGRTVHSTIPLLLELGVGKVYAIAPEELQFGREIRENSRVETMESWDEILPKLDVLYMTRIQEERFTSREEYEKFKGSYSLSDQELKYMKEECIILDPLPRIEGTYRNIDNDPRAWYFRQAQNGLYVRMALLESLFKKV
jgi:aspartate carbamoyltransferase catalytic subunit